MGIELLNDCDKGVLDQFPGPASMLIAVPALDTCFSAMGQYVKISSKTSILSVCDNSDCRTCGFKMNIDNKCKLTKFAGDPTPRYVSLSLVC